MNDKYSVQGFEISTCSAAVIGCGGLGTNVAVHLAGSGIGKLLLWDFDAVEQRNLNRQFMYTAEDIGKAKSLVLKNKMKDYAPECAVESVCVKIETFAQLFSATEFDIVILAVDNIACRKIVSAFCEQRGIPYINGSINGFYGTAYLCLPGKTPPLSAAGGLEEVSGKQLSPSMSAGIIGALEAKLAVDYFLGNTRSAGKLFCYDGETIQELAIKESDSVDQL
ncbi:MAG: ThiF family adenylyltransferase [Clostridia bacterium]|nr:ThiF family adenylyltransferase [Clostridia bacterium]